MDIYITIIFLVLLLVIFLRLRSVLGRRTGTERPPIEPFPRRNQVNAPSNDKVVPLPQRSAPRDVEATAAPADNRGNVIDPFGNVASTGAALPGALAAVMRADRNFNADHFLAGAKAAYEMIVNAFAKGDRAALKPLLSKEVYDGFDHAIGEREKAGHKVESSFVGLEKAEITEAAMRGNTAQITVRFVSNLIQATRGADGSIVDGDPTRVTEVTDVWTFARDVTARDPNWRLIATEAA